MNIVVVEDSIVIQMHLISMLAMIEGVHVVGQATTEDGAFQIIEKLRPDLVLMDISLETGTGINVLRKMRRADNTAQVLMLTNHNEGRFRELSMELGAQGYFDKTKEIDLAFAKISEISGYEETAIAA